MKNQKSIVIAMAVVLVFLVAGILYSRNSGQNPLKSTIPKTGTKGPVACTMEAKQCPDGSYVGRQGPRCEFAQCPNASSSVVISPSITLLAKLGETVTGSGLRITPLVVTEDSRCPAGVMCIQAGRVAVQVKIESALGTSEPSLTVGQSITTEAETVTLVSVSPEKLGNPVGIQPADYRFSFEIRKR